VIDDYLY